MPELKFDGNVPKTLRTFANRNIDRVQEITGKGILYHDCYDVLYQPGWCSGSDPMGAVHSDNGATVAELISRIKHARPCDCEECKREAAK